MVQVLHASVPQDRNIITGNTNLVEALVLPGSAISADLIVFVDGAGNSPQFLPPKMAHHQVMLEDDHTANACADRLELGVSYDRWGRQTTVWQTTSKNGCS